MAYYIQILRPIMEHAPGSQRTDRESRTLCMALDIILQGDPLRSIMILLGRLKALKSLLVPGSQGWQEAQLHERVAARGAGLLTASEMENTARDMMDQRRIEDFRGRGLPPKARGGVPAAGERTGGDRRGAGRGAHL